METRLDTMLGKWKVTSPIENYSVPTSEAVARMAMVIMNTTGGGVGDYNQGVEDTLRMQKRVTSESACQSQWYTSDQWVAMCGWMGITGVAELQPVWLKMKEKRDGFAARTLLLDTIDALQTDMEHMMNKVQLDWPCDSGVRVINLLPSRGTNSLVFSDFEISRAFLIF